MVPLVIQNNEFCAGKDFKGSIIDILYKYLFEQKAGLETIYDEMKKEINADSNLKIKLYPVGGESLKKLDPQHIQRNNSIYAGHDLPVWLNDPESADIRIMVISQDPRRNEKEMKENNMPTSNVISISTPFGLHFKNWRSHKSKGLVHYLFDDMKNMFCNKKLGIYYTDIYKFRGVDSEDLDTSNLNVYINVLSCEIQLFKPDVILLMGKEAQDAWKTINPAINDTSKTKFIETPHPNARSIIWRKIYPDMQSCSSEKKRRMLLNEINGSLRRLKK
jgi:hypothetical protein